MPIAQGLDENRANEVVVALGSSQIAVTKELDPNGENTFQIVVGSDDVSVAIATLHNAGLPTRENPGVLESLGETGLVTSQGAEHARLIAGTAGELERSLQAISGVLTARVHLAVPLRDALAIDEEPVPASASVLLRHAGATPPLAAPDLQRLVSGAVSGLEADAVAVVLHPVVAAPIQREDALSRLGPIAVSRSSVAPLRIVLIVAALLNVALMLVVVFMWTRLRSSSRAGEGNEGTT